MNKRIRKKKIKYHFMKMKKDEYVLCYVPVKYGNDIKDLKAIRDTLNKFVDNRFLILPNDISILKYSKEDTIKILEQQIEKIKNS